MFELDINKIKEQSMQFVDTAYKAAMDIADKGKNQLDLASAPAGRTGLQPA